MDSGSHMIRNILERIAVSFSDNIYVKVKPYGGKHYNNRNEYMSECNAKRSDHCNRTAYITQNPEYRNQHCYKEGQIKPSQIITAYVTKPFHDICHLFFSGH